MTLAEAQRLLSLLAREHEIAAGTGDKFRTDAVTTRCIELDNAINGVMMTAPLPPGWWDEYTVR